MMPHWSPAPEVFPEPPTGTNPVHLLATGPEGALVIAQSILPPVEQLPLVPLPVQHANGVPAPVQIAVGARVKFLSAKVADPPPGVASQKIVMPVRVAS